MNSLVTLVDITLMIVFAALKFSYWSFIIPGIFGNILRIVLYRSYTKVRLRFLKRKYLIVGFRKAKSIIGNLTGFNLLNYWARNSDQPDHWQGIWFYKAWVFITVHTKFSVWLLE